MKKTKAKKIGKPNALLLWTAGLVLIPYYFLRYGMKIDRSGLKGISGPALVLCPHISGNDHLITAMALYPKRPTYVVSEHFMTRPKLRPYLKLMHVITKKMYTVDVSAIMNILKAKRENNILVLFPEGRLSCFGHSLPVTEGTAELVKKLGVDVYTITGNGAYLTFPKWSPLSRRGKIYVTTEKLFHKEDILTLSLEEIRGKIDASILHDDEKAMEGVTYRCQDMTLGLDGILYRCPNCMGEGTLKGGNNHMVCTCGLDVTLDAAYHFDHSSPFPTINAWYFWQESLLDPEILRLESKVKVGTPDGNNEMNSDAGQGEISLDKDVFTFRGVVDGKALSFETPTKNIGAFPITVGKEFDLYHNGRLYYFYPLPDGRAAVKWVSFMDVLTRYYKEKQ